MAHGAPDPHSDGRVGYLFPRAWCPASSSPAFSLLGEPCSPQVPGPFLTCLQGLEARPTVAVLSVLPLSDRSSLRSCHRRGPHQNTATGCVPGQRPALSAGTWSLWSLLDSAPHSALAVPRWRKPCTQASGPQERFSTRSRLTTRSMFFPRRDRAVSPKGRDRPAFSRSATPERPGPGGHLSAWPHWPALPTPEGPAQRSASLGNSHLHVVKGPQFWVGVAPPPSPSAYPRQTG